MRDAGILTDEDLNFDASKEREAKSADLIEAAAFCLNVEGLL